MFHCFEQNHDNVNIVSDNPNDSCPYYPFVERIDAISQKLLDTFWPLFRVGIVLVVGIELCIR